MRVSLPVIFRRVFLVPRNDNRDESRMPVLAHHPIAAACGRRLADVPAEHERRVADDWLLREMHGCKRVCLLVEQGPNSCIDLVSSILLELRERVVDYFAQHSIPVCVRMAPIRPISPKQIMVAQALRLDFAFAPWKFSEGATHAREDIDGHRQRGFGCNCLRQIRQDCVDDGLGDARKVPCALHGAKAYLRHIL